MQMLTRSSGSVASRQAGGAGVGVERAGGQEVDGGDPAPPGVVVAEREVPGGVAAGVLVAGAPAGEPADGGAQVVDDAAREGRRAVEHGAGAVAAVQLAVGVNAAAG